MQPVQFLLFESFVILFSLTVVSFFFSFLTLMKAHLGFNDLQEVT